MSTSSRLKLVCVDNSEFSLHAFSWYIDNVYNKDNDILSLVHVHDLPYLPRFGEASVRAVLTEEYHEMMEQSIRNAKGEVRFFLVFSFLYQICSGQKEME